MWSNINKIMEGYGSFFALTHPLSRLLIFICAILQPASGFCGILGGASVLVWRKLLQFNLETERIEIINGILLGSLLGSLYGITVGSALLTVTGSVLVVIASAIFSDTIGKKLRLPLLGTPYAAVGFVLLEFAHAIRLPELASISQSWLLIKLDPVLPLGAMYFNGTGVGGLLVLIAFLLSSRYLAFLAIGASLCSSIFLKEIGLSPYSMISIVAQMNSVLAACVIGGLFASPSKRSFLVSLAASVFASALTLALNQLLSLLGLPVLALPFVMVCYTCMLVFNSNRSNAWTYFWQSTPCLPEQSLEQIQIAQERGVDYRCIGLKMPLKGKWNIYQGFGGAHTHQGNWHYALDFFQTEEALSFINDGTKLSDYFAWGKPVLSPCFGVVVEARSDLADNAPGDVDTVNNWGNYLLIRLDCGSYVILAHLQQHSIRVASGSKLRPGDLLALVGNSGRSPQPHLHMHVQESLALGSKTIPFHLTGIIEHKSDLEFYAMRSCPQEHDLISAPALNPALKRSLRLAVGSRFLFETENERKEPDLRRLEVNLDLAGQFWLESDLGAKVAFSQSDELLAFYSRQGGKDAFLDAFILAFATMPLLEGDLSWKDVMPRRLLPQTWLDKLSHAILYPLSPCARSKFKRVWNPLRRVWTQSASHRLGLRTYTSSAILCEAQGILEFSLATGPVNLLKARLISLGAREDNGIPQWTASLPLLSASQLAKITEPGLALD